MIIPWVGNTAEVTFAGQTITLKIRELEWGWAWSASTDSVAEVGETMGFEAALAKADSAARVLMSKLVLDYIWKSKS